MNLRSKISSKLFTYDEKRHKKNKNRTYDKLICDLNDFLIIWNHGGFKLAIKNSTPWHFFRKKRDFNVRNKEKN